MHSSYIELIELKGFITAMKFKSLFISASIAVALSGCVQSEDSQSLNYELRWCASGQESCDVEEAYVKGGFFEKLKECNDAISHLKYYGVNIGGECFMGDATNP